MGGGGGERSGEETSTCSWPRDAYILVQKGSNFYFVWDRHFTTRDWGITEPRCPWYAMQHSERPTCKMRWDAIADTIVWVK